MLRQSLFQINLLLTVTVRLSLIGLVTVGVFLIASVVAAACR